MGWKKNAFELLDIIKNVDKAVISQNFKNVGNQSAIYIYSDNVKNVGTLTQISHAMFI